MSIQNRGIIARLITCAVYLGIFLMLCRWCSGDWLFLQDANNTYNMLFVSGALLLILGTYLAEPYFTKPLDVLTNSITIILALLSIRSPDEFVGYYYLFYTAFILLILSIITILCNAVNKFKFLQHILFVFVTKIGNSKVSFSTIYLFTIISYLKHKPVSFAFFLTFWVIFISEFIANWIVDAICTISDKWHTISSTAPLGQAIGCENPFLYKVEVDNQKYHGPQIHKGDIVLFSNNSITGIIGLIVDVRFLINKQWLSIYLLHNGNTFLKISKNDIAQYISNIQNIPQTVYHLDMSKLASNHQKEIQNNALYKNKEAFLGYVIEGSDINKIKFFPILNEHDANYSLLTEGTIITTHINGQESLFQIIEGKTSKEILETHNASGYIVGIAQKLGKYNNTTHDIDSVKWLPSMYSPLFFNNTTSEQKINTPCNKTTIGYLPNTQKSIDIKDFNALITHNTAILGILGIGKSCLTFELIQKIINNTHTKIICIDITNEYGKQLKQYIPEKLLNVDNEHTFQTLNTSKDHIDSKDYTKSGNLQAYHTEIKRDLTEFLYGNKNKQDILTFDMTQRIRIYNPDFHPVSKGEKAYQPISPIPLTQAEKVRIICEELYKILMKLPITSEARVLVVFEEAHSLIPEWNSTANPSDSHAVNGTSKIILQGRKYGLGSLIVTQRTANISKSILNQCNTIFALRVFDDTGKTFLENYIGTDFSNLLPTLEERHAIAVGKALKLRLPVIIRLNNQQDIINIPH